MIDLRTLRKQIRDDLKEEGFEGKDLQEKLQVLYEEAKAERERKAQREHELEMERLKNNSESRVSNLAIVQEKLKIPVYEEDMDLDAWFDMFENELINYKDYIKVKEIKKAFLKCSVASSMIKCESPSYQELKDLIITYYGHSMDFYRLKFRDIVLKGNSVQNLCFDVK